jgi:hypothetical protein
VKTWFQSLLSNATCAATPCQVLSLDALDVSGKHEVELLQVESSCDPQLESARFHTLAPYEVGKTGFKVLTVCFQTQLVPLHLGGHRRRAAQAARVRGGQEPGGVREPPRGRGVRLSAVLPRHPGVARRSQQVALALHVFALFCGQYVMFRVDSQCGPCNQPDTRE